MLSVVRVLIDGGARAVRSLERRAVSGSGGAFQRALVRAAAQQRPVLVDA